MTPEIESRASGTTFKEISASRFGETIVILPPLDEQRRIVDAVESNFSRLESALNSTKRAAELNVKMISGALVGMTVYHAERTGWDELVIGQMAKVSTGATPLKSRADYYRGGTIPWVTSTLLNKPIINATDTMITQRALEETSVKLFPPGTLLLAMYGEGRTRGRVAELQISATTNQACAAIQLLPEYEDYRSWVKLVLEASYEQTRRLASGGVQPNLSLGIVRGIRIPLPPPDIRDDILAEIESMRAVSNRFTSTVKFLAAQGRQLRAQILQRAFDGALIPPTQ
jgi:type I restriction enzyme S subunit